MTRRKNLADQTGQPGWHGMAPGPVEFKTEQDQARRLQPPPSMLDLGWSCSSRGARYDHESGASVELDGSATDGTLAARINDGAPVPVASLAEALERALSARSLVSKRVQQSLFPLFEGATQ